MIDHLLAAAPWPVALSVRVHGNHRHPVPGEVQTQDWKVHNDGTRRLDGVFLEVRVPGDWSMRTVPGCRRAQATLVQCALGPLAPGQGRSLRIAMRVPEHPRLGACRISGTTSAIAGGMRYAGPSASVNLTVVDYR